MRTIATLAFASSLLAGSGSARADDEITLFDGRGRASAYIAPDDEGTIYLWSGKPVAYLDADSASGFHICGFNGKHLGWFVGGIVRAHDGNATCAVKERLRSTQFEPFKGFKQFKPFKGFKEFAPYPPFFATFWADTPCRLLVITDMSNRIPAFPILQMSYHHPQMKTPASRAGASCLTLRLR